MSLELPEKARILVEETFRKAMAEINLYPELAACRNFSELHDVCDANCLRGACDDDNPFWNDPDYYDAEAGFTELGAVVSDARQAKIDSELRRRASGHPANTENCEIPGRRAGSRAAI